MKKAGIYRITNINNSKIYIGSAKNLAKRQTQHFSNLKHNRHTNKYLQNSYNKNGVDSFVFEIIQYVDNIENLIFYEQQWINLTYCYNKKYGYNLCEIADRPMIGKTITSEHKEILRKKNTGESNYWFGKKFNDEHKSKLKLSRKNQKMTNNSPVLQFDLNGVFIKEWNTISETKVIARNVSPCCRGLRKKSGGYIWKYKE